VLVTLPETTPVNEVVETAFALEDRVGVQLGPLVINGVDRPAIEPESIPDGARRGGGRVAAVDDDPDGPLLLEAAEFRRRRLELQRTEIARVGAELALDQWLLPLLPVAALGVDDVRSLAHQLVATPT
jgi:hypothetical protein